MTFDKILFLGNYPQSAATCYELHQRLDRCFSDLSGLQQDTSGQNTQQNNIAKADIIMFVRDLSMALTGKEIVFKD
jgi:hypothetical protein